ncbi:MAG: GTP-binding protein [Chromatiaceae bacterium]|jgi:elongation factor G|nr:GTP-binding protein [Chromatiaceae bacterium]
MSKSSLSHVRNIGVAAHVDAGKTTLTERILYYTGASHKIGEVHDGAAHMDYLAEEQSHGITITSAVTRAPWRDHLLQIVDTPGHVDFTIEVERSMRVLDGAILVLDGVRGVEPQTETVWRQRSRFQLPVLFFVNKMDRPGADFRRALESIRKRLGAEPVPIVVPLPEEQAVVHLIHGTRLRFTGDQGREVIAEPCPASLWARMAGYREALLLAAAEAEDGLADRVLAGEDPEPAELWAALRRGTLSGAFFPCFGGSALRNQGVQPLLDAVVELLPAPLDRPPATAMRPNGTTEEVAMEAKGPLAALVFKVQMWEGRRHVFARLYRGRLRPGDTVEFLTSDGRTLKEHAARLFDVDAGRKTKLEEAGPGQIVLLAGLRHASTGDTLCQPGHVLSLERIETRRPVLSLAIEPVASGDEEKLVEALGKVQEEDPTLRVEEDAETGQRLLRGMGELHLQIVRERLEREFGLAVRAGRPAVAVRETIRSPAVGEALYAPPPIPEQKIPERTARARVAVTPLPRGTGVRLRSAVRVLPEGAVLSPEQTRALESGMRMAMESGPLQGSTVEDVDASLIEVELFGQASTLDALSAAAARATGRALQAATPALLRPVMAVEVVVPEDNLGTVLGDLQARRAAIHDTVREAGTVTIACEVPLEQLLGYTTDLRSQTQGRGQFSMLFDRFDLV